jgi:NTE family protein
MFPQSSAGFAGTVPIKALSREGAKNAKIADISLSLSFAHFAPSREHGSFRSAVPSGPYRKSRKIVNTNARRISAVFFRYPTSRLRVPISFPNFAVTRTRYHPRMPIAPLSAHKPRSLALQGGGAHGAFTWGVLDRLLEENAFHVDGICATSSGAMNALALAQGWLDGGRDGARAALTALWENIASQTSLLRWAFSTPAGAATETLLLGLTRYFTPQEINPLGINPLRDIALASFDFERLRRHSPFRLYLAATRVRDGRLVLFGDGEVSVDALLASTCLPQLFAPVEIGGELYWDGGYAGNPALEPLIYQCRSADILCILVQPLELGHLPRNVREIQERIAELGFSTTFLRELETVRRAQKSLLHTFPLSSIGRRLKKLNIDLIEPGESLAAYSAKTRMNTRLGFLQNLREAGRAQAQAWLELRHG